MCGIAGVLRIHPPGQAPPPPDVAIPEGWLDILDDSIRHRGPDGHGRFRDRAVRPDGSIVDVAFIHRRLSIIDHAGGHQPMVLRGAGPPAGDIARKGDETDAYRHTLEHTLNPCPRCAALGHGTIAVVFNGCIYNHRDLRKDLQAAGHVFSTDHSDTEVLVHGYGEWGPAMRDRIEGMHAVGIWDRRAGAIVQLRDFAGEKPLYFSYPGPPLHRPALIAAFASAPTALVRLQRAAAPEFCCAPNDRALYEWVRAGSHGDSPLTLVHELPPEGCEVLPREACVHQGGSIALPVQTSWPEADARHGRMRADDVERLLSGVVAKRLAADVPLGCFLSGGVDSSLIALLAQRECDRQGTRLRTFTVRMPDRTLDESGMAARVAAIIGTEHHVLDAAPEPAADLCALITRLGLPFGDSSLLPTHWVSRAARAAVAVALSGDGADELFGGYERHRAARWLSAWRPVLSRVPAGAVPERHPRSASSKMRRLVAAASGWGYFDLLSIFPQADTALLFSSRYVRRDVRFIDVEDPLQQDFAGYLPDDLLRKSDTASMATALEVRAPYLDRSFAVSALTTALDDLMPKGQRKGLLRAVARKYFPPEIVDRPKQGFAIPIGEWFRTDYGGMRQLLLDHLDGPEPFGPDHLGINAMINMGFVKQMLREHDDAGVKSLWPWKGRDHSQRLYMLLVLSIWAKWLGGL